MWDRTGTAFLPANRRTELRQARSMCVSEQLLGTLFLAILIARLAGVYPPPAEAKVKDTQ